jgi:hypothetical protein
MIRSNEFAEEGQQVSIIVAPPTFLPAAISKTACNISHHLPHPNSPRGVAVWVVGANT